MRILTVLSLCGVLFCPRPASAADRDPAAAQEVLSTLEAMAAAIIRKDVATLDRMYHADLTYNHSTGLSQNKAEIMRAVPSGTFETMRFSNPNILVYGSVAVVQTTTNLRYYPGGVAADRHLNQLYVLVKGPSGWQIVARHTTRIQP